ncbi:NAD(P)H-binding protein [Mesonia sp. MT50]|uniref:NAD(P)H-binding protein n=1 Tax=Mesonia profundi TaxID=3070998 RepID=A0ABU1A0I6_9FLAO|nr:NAD(P)H-binding protein [Mesonia profundi]MDQ7917172.1 NAD(P)H-binding protein [Mesonia profundi]
MQKKKTALILGATGLTGSTLLQELLVDDRYAKVKVFTRRSLGFTHPKLVEYKVDLFRLTEEKENFTGDEVFCCIGSTKKKTPNDEVYEKVDVGIPSVAAKLSKENGIDTFIVISALGADAKSRFFYNQMKGKMEAHVLQQKIEHTYILRPSLISGKRKEKRVFESLWNQLMKVANGLMMGPLKKFRSISAQSIVKTMIVLANSPQNEPIIESEEIHRIWNKT